MSQSPLETDLGVQTAADDLRGDVESLRRRLDEQASIAKRTHETVNRLTESVAHVVASQRRRERFWSLNSFVAYLVFTVLLGGGFYALYRARAGELVSAHERAVHDRDVWRTSAEEARSELKARSEGAELARAYYQLLSEDRRSEAVARYAEVAQAEISDVERAVFADGEKRARAQLVDAGYIAGLDAFRAGQNETALTELRRALAYEEEGPRAAQMRYYLGRTMLTQSDTEGALRQLELAIAGRVDQAGVVDARFYLATALEKLGRFEEARAEFDRFANANPQHPLSVSARRQSAALARKASRTN